MGYSTSYKLEIRSPKTGKPVCGETFALLIEDLKAHSEGAQYALGDDGRTEESCKWYDHEKDMNLFSSRHPVFLFVLSGEGEESGDLWRRYFLAGKNQYTKATLQFDPFDPAKLTKTGA